MSNPGHVPAVLHYLVGLAPRSILDIGVGLGTYGFLAREFLDVAEGRLDKALWRTRIDGIEIFEPYRNPVWDHFYDRMMIGDLRDRIASLDLYEVILCNDVLEHFPHDEARNLITTLLGRCRVLIATTPAHEFPQGAWGGNDAESHHCLLARDDFPASTHVHRTGVTSLYVSSSDAQAGLEIAELARTVPRITYPSRSVAQRLRARVARLVAFARP